MDATGPQRRPRHRLRPAALDRCLVGSDELHESDDRTTRLLVLYALLLTTLLCALVSFRKALLRRCHAASTQHANRLHTKLTEQWPQKELERFCQIVQIGPDGSHTINPRLDQAIRHLEAELEQRNKTQRRH